MTDPGADDQPACPDCDTLNLSKAQDGPSATNDADWYCRRCKQPVDEPNWRPRKAEPSRAAEGTLARKLEDTPPEDFATDGGVPTTHHADMLSGVLYSLAGAAFLVGAGVGARPEMSLDEGLFVIFGLGLAGIVWLSMGLTDLKRVSRQRAERGGDGDA